MELLYKVGDRIELIVDLTNYTGDGVFKNPLLPSGTTGTVRRISNNGNYGVEWDIDPKEGLKHSLHSCDHTCEDGRGWYVKPQFVYFRPLMDKTEFLSLLRGGG